MKIQENQINKDDNGTEMFIGEEQGRLSVDLTGNGDCITCTYHGDDLWVFEDDLQSHTHFTEDIEVTIEAYIEEEEEGERKNKLSEMMNQALKIQG